MVSCPPRQNISFAKESGNPGWRHRGPGFDTPTLNDVMWHWNKPFSRIDPVGEGWGTWLALHTESKTTKKRKYIFLTVSKYCELSVSAVHCTVECDLCGGQKRVIKSSNPKWQRCIKAGVGLDNRSEWKMKWWILGSYPSTGAMHCSM